jgi:hypothetical protein
MTEPAAPRFVLMEDVDGDYIIVDTVAGLGYGFLRQEADEPEEAARLLAKATSNPEGFGTIYHAMPVEQIEGLHDPEVSE